MVIEQTSLFAKKTKYKGIEISNPHISVKQLEDPVFKGQMSDWVCYDFKPLFAIKILKFADEDWHFSYKFYDRDWENGSVVNQLQDLDDRIENQVEKILRKE